MNNEKKDFVCRICGSGNASGKYIAREMMFGFRDEFVYHQCAECGCLQISEFPSDIAKYYPGNYYSRTSEERIKFSGVKGYFRRFFLSGWVMNKTWVHKICQWFYTPVSLRVLKNLNVNRETRILDVGCGDGQKFLFPLAELGFQNLAGCDPFLETDIVHPNGLKISKADIFAMKGKWDVITYHHVFEHVPDPLGNLIRISELLSDEGICVLRMPTVSSYAWDHYKVNWVQLDAPRHFFLHSLKSIRHMAKMTAFSLARIEYDSTYKQFADSEGYIADKPLRQPRPRGLLNFLRRKLKKYRFKKLADEMNKKQLGDQAAFYLKKIPKVAIN